MSLNNYLLVSSNYNRRRRHRRNIRRNRNQIMNGIYRVTVNNTNTLNRITQLPLQVSNDPFANQLLMDLNV